MLKSGRFRLATRFAGILLLLALIFGLRRTDEVSAQSTSGGRPIDLILLIDGSPSMKTTDPDNYRLDAARFLVDYLGAIGQVFDLNNRIAYAYFGSDVGRSQSLVTPQTGSVRDQLVLSTSDATDPALTGGTDFRTALQFALRELKGRGAARDRDVVVILFTDGHPAFTGLDATPGGIERYFRADISDGKGAMPSLVGELKQLGANLFVVGIGEAQSDALNWEGLLGQKRFRTIGGAKLDSASELIGIYREFVAPFTDTDLSNSIRIVDGSEATVQQSGLLDGAVFSVVKAKNSSVLTLTTPAGRVIRPSLGGGGERYEIFAADPAAGAWRVRASGGDAVLFYDSRPARLTLAMPLGPLVAGDGIDAQLRLTLRGVVTAPIGFAPTLELITSLNQRIQLPPMSSDAQNVFRAAISPTLVSLPGTYQLSPVLSGIYSGSVRTATERFTTYLRPSLLSFDVQGVLQPGADVTVTARIENASRLPPGYAPGLTLKDSASRVVASPPMLAAERLARGNDVEQVYRAIVRLPSSEGGVLFELTGRGSSRDGVLFDVGSRYGSDMRYPPTPAAGTTTPTPTPNTPGSTNWLPWIVAGLAILLLGLGLGIVANRLLTSPAQTTSVTQTTAGTTDAGALLKQSEKERLAGSKREIALNANLAQLRVANEDLKRKLAIDLAKRGMEDNKTKRDKGHTELLANLETLRDIQTPLLLRKDKLTKDEEDELLRINRLLNAWPIAWEGDVKSDLVANLTASIVKYQETIAGDAFRNIRMCAQNAVTVTGRQVFAAKMLERWESNLNSGFIVELQTILELECGRLILGELRNASARDSDSTRPGFKARMEAIHAVADFYGVMGSVSQDDKSS